MIISSNQYLDRSQMKGNAEYILSSFLKKGWSKNAICGMLGNMETESTMNPGLWESLQEGNMTGGFGLVQWTPATEVTEWLTSHGYQWGDIEGQILRIQDELDNNLQWIPTSEYPMSFKEFSTSDKSPDYLAMVFIKNYERPLNSDQPIRGEQALYWYKTLTGEVPPLPGEKKKSMPLYFYLKRRF